MIVSDAVDAYLAESRRPPDPVLAEMETHGERDHISTVNQSQTGGGTRIVEKGFG